MIKNVFFDFNGTLIDDIDLTLDIENKLLVQRGLNAVTKEFYLDNFCFPVINYYRLILIWLKIYLKQYYLSYQAFDLIF